jgi:predicted kinase
VTSAFPPCPKPPDWTIDWATLDEFPWIRDLRGCPQNPVRHAEGDVWTHVHMVCEAMAALPAFRELPEADRSILFAAGLLHDVAKPVCTRREADGSISSRGHSWRGAVKARQILWRRGVSFGPREHVAAIVRHHLVPFFLSESENPTRLAIEVSQTARCDWLAIMAESDARGRVCPDPDQLLRQIEQYRQVCREAGCFGQPYPFPDDHARFRFFREPAPLETGAEFAGEVILMSGLPGAGKDYWIRQHSRQLEVISLDALRISLGVAPSDPQGLVLQRAREIAIEHLRAGRSFIWNASNLSRHARGECVRFFHERNARVRIVYVEATPDRLFAQNRQRRRKVPESVIERLLDRWEVPDRTEAHHVEWIVDGRDGQAADAETRERA